MSTEAATATSVDDFANSMNAFMGGLEAQLGKSLAPLKDISEKLGSSKFGKNIKAFGGAMKGMAGASVNAWAMEQLMKLIEPFMKLLKLLEIPINVLAMLLQMFVNEIFVQLLPFFLEFSLLLLELTPIFKILGQIVGKVLVIALEHIITIFRVLFKALGELWNLFKKSPFFEKLKEQFAIVWDFLKRVFIPLWGKMKEGMAVLKKAWDDSGGKIFGKDGFIAKGFRALMDVAKNIVNGVIRTINNIITKINDLVGTNFGMIPTLAKGGITTGPTLAMIGDNPGGVERVQPLENGGFGKEAQILAATEETNRLLQRLIKMNLDADRMRGFG